METVENHYRTLGITSDATYAEIKLAYRSLVRGLHPDKHNDKEKEELLKELNKAYNVLKNPNSRKNYDLGFRNGNSPDAIERQAMDFINNTILKLLENRDEFYEDICGGLVQETKQLLHAADNQLLQIESRITRLTKNKVKLLSKNNTSDLVLLAIETRINAIEATKENVSKNILVGKKILELVLDLKFELSERPKEGPTMQGTPSMYPPGFINNWK